MKNYMAIVVSNNIVNIQNLQEDINFELLTIGGSYRIIDFILSNIVNSGISNIGIITNQKNGKEIEEYIKDGREWDLNRKKDGIFIFDDLKISNGKINLKKIYKCVNYILKSSQENVVIFNTQAVLNLDLKEIILEYEKSKGDITIVETQANKEVGIFILKKILLVKLFIEAIYNGEGCNIKEIINKKLKDLNVNKYVLSQSVIELTSIKDYFDFNMELLNKRRRDELFFKERKVYSKILDIPPIYLKGNSKVINSLIGDGGIIEGKIENSVISQEVVIEENCEIKNCILLDKVIIKQGVKLQNVIVENGCIVNFGNAKKCSRLYPEIIWRNEKEKIIN